MTQRIGTGTTPARYQSAVPLVISTSRLVRPYQRLMRQRCQCTLGSLRMAESFFKRLPLIAGRPRPLRFGGGEANRLASTQPCDDTDMVAHRGEELDSRKCAIGDEDDVAARKPAADLQGGLPRPVDQRLGRSQFACVEALGGCEHCEEG